MALLEQAQLAAAQRSATEACTEAETARAAAATATAAASSAASEAESHQSEKVVAVSSLEREVRGTVANFYGT